MKNKILTILTLIVSLSVYAQSGPPNPCPTCPPNTNIFTVTNNAPIYYPTGSLLIRASAIFAYNNLNGSDSRMVMTNRGWIETSNGLILSADAWLDSILNASTNKYWKWQLALTNSDPEREYGFFQTTALPGHGVPFSPRLTGNSNIEIFYSHVFDHHEENNRFYVARDVTGTNDGWVYSTVTVGSGGVSGQCPGPYIARVSYTKPNPAFGWLVNTNTTVHMAIDGTGRNDTKIEYGGNIGDSGCNTGFVLLPANPLSSTYRFTIYFPSNAPTNGAPYPIVLIGFAPAP